MTIEVAPETELLVRREITSGHFVSVDDLIEKGLQAWKEKQEAANVPQSVANLNLVEICAMVSGLTDDIDFSRNKAGARPVDLD